MRADGKVELLRQRLLEDNLADNRLVFAVNVVGIGECRLCSGMVCLAVSPAIVAADVCRREVGQQICIASELLIEIEV